MSAFLPTVNNYVVSIIQKADYRMKKHLIPLLIVLLLSVYSSTALATNAAGGEIISEWLSDSTYRFFLKYYRVCNGVAEPNTMSLCFNDPCNANSFNVTMTKFSSINAASSCPTRKNSCDSAASNIPGLSTVTYSAIITLPARCTQWRAFISIPNRVATNNIANSTTVPMYLEYTFNNTGNYQGNSSPYFSISPFPTVSLNTPSTYNNGAVDVNGDSLVTQVIHPQTAAAGCTSSPSNAGFVSSVPNITIPSNPFHTNYTFSIHQPSGNMSFVPVMTGLASVAVRVTEYRNGVWIGSLIRENTINVQQQTVPPPTLSLYKDCNTSNPPVSGGFNSGTIYGCIGQPLSFCFDIKNTDTNTIYYLSDNHSFTIPGANITYSNIGNDSVRATFTWTPTSNDIGIKNLVFTVKDSTCRPYWGAYYFTYPASIYIWEPTIASSDTLICAGDSVALTVNGAGNFAWQQLTPGASTLSCTSCSNPIAKPTVNTLYAVSSQFINFCPNNKDTVLIYTMPKVPPTVAYGDTTICVSQLVSLSATGSGSYNWYILNGSFNSLSCNNCPNPVVSPVLTTSYVVQSSIIGCVHNQDTVTVTVRNDRITYPGISIESNYGGEALKGLPVTFKVRITDCTNPSYQWVLNGNDIPFATESTLTRDNLKTGDIVYCKMVCNDNCAANKNLNSNIITMTITNSVESLSNMKQNITIYPNPGNGIITISATSEKAEKYNIHIINNMGQIVYPKSVIQLGNGIVKEVDLRLLPTGIYTIKLNETPYKIAIN